MSRDPIVSEAHDRLDEYIAAQVIGDIRLNHIRDARHAFERATAAAVRFVRARAATVKEG